MTDDLNKPATKADLFSLENRMETKLNSLEDSVDSKLKSLEARMEAKLNSLEERMDDKFENVIDQIVRAIQVSEENIRQDCAHVDELAEVKNRIARIEDHLGLDKHN